jgi:hypothetical protein
MTCAPDASRRSATRPEALVAAALRALGGLLLAALAGFHVWLLGLHVVTGEAFEPTTAVRWALAALVLAGFRALNRRGLPLLVGRRAVGLWVLVVVIHASAAWDGGGVAFGAAIPESAAAFAQVTAAATLVGAVIGATLAAPAGHDPAVRRGDAAPALVAGLPSSGFAFSFSPRPPPLA